VEGCPSHPPYSYSYSYSNWLSTAECPTREPEAHGVKATNLTPSPQNPPGCNPSPDVQPTQHTDTVLLLPFTFAAGPYTTTLACCGLSCQGYLSAAMVNYLSLLGWNDGSEKEIYT